ncbi:hypothetical protein [Ferruginivarius sediminum]|uniref:ATP synthase subunit b n=1 Tax=Ferruginivarius sediminum TaxID=2661937 RepID=A0A369TA89_9PROT|nr:hypothetical protein [Ferruginivarius sediminum]RDD62249.1 hypothetical protein DRB17_08430 [Ferruginivarius sediminum]
MQIDWVTVAAQIVNFVILVWLLKRFLYRPVVRAMARREQHIADRLHEAEDREKAAQDKAEAYAEKERDLEQKRDELLRDAREEAKSYRKELRQEVREDMEAERRQMHKQVARDQADFVRDLRRQIAEQFEALARRAMSDLADSSLEAQIADAFANRVRDMDADLRQRIAEAALREDGRLTVTSAFDLPADVRRQVTRVLHEAFGDRLDVIYEQSDDLTCGIELRAAGHSVLWSLDAYLDEFEERLAEKIQEMAAKTQPEAA